MSTTQPIRSKCSLEEFKDYYRKAAPHPRNYCLIIFGLNTALRISDILKTTWENVYDFKKCSFRSHLEMTEQKTGKHSSIALNASVVTALKHLKKEVCPLPQDYLFMGQKSKAMPISRQQAYRIIRKAASACGLTEHISCHSLRKTFGYYAWKCGTPPAMLMHIFNHSSYQITCRYLGIEQDEKDDVFHHILL